MKDIVTLEQITNDLHKFMTSFLKTPFDYNDFHSKVRRSFSDLQDIEESSLTISDGVRIPMHFAPEVRKQLFLRLKLLYGLSPKIVTAFNKYNSKKKVKSEHR